MNKRLMSFVTAIVLIYNMLTGTAAFGTEISSPSSDSERAVGLLTALGIIKDVDNIDLSSNISRSDFAAYAAALYNGKAVYDDDLCFIDVPKEHFAASAIGILYNIGAVSKGDDGKFEPDRNITYDEAIKILTVMLGFGEISEADGGFPYGYRKTASRIKLGVSNSGGELKTDTALELIYKTANISIFDTQKILFKDNKYNSDRVQSEVTFLSIYFDVYGVSDTVTATDKTALDSGAKCVDSKIRIGDKEYIITDNSADELIGSEVMVFYRQTSEHEPEIICLFEENCEKTDISYSNIKGFDGKSFAYFDLNGKERSVSVNNYTVVVRNGVIVTENISSAFDIDYGTVKIRKNKEGIKNTVIIINACETYCVKYADYVKKTVYDKFNTSKNLNLTDEKTETYKIIDSKTGTDVPFGYIVPGSILSVFKSMDGTTTDIFISTESVEGIAEAKSAENGESKIKVSGMEYSVNPQVEKYINITLGSSVRAYLDIYGNICDIQKSNGEWSLGYIFKMASGNDFEQTKIKLLNEDGRILEFSCADILNIDGVRITSADAAYNAVAAKGDMGTYRQLIRYKLNESGYVSHIDTADSQTENSGDGSLIISNPYEGTSVQYYQVAKCFYPSPLMDRDTKVFIVPFETDENPTDRQFGVTDKSYFTKTDKYPVSAYKTDISYPYADAVVLRREGTAVIEPQTKTALIGEIREGIDENGENTAILEVLISGSPQELYCSDDVDASILGVGDIIRVGYNFDGKVSMIERVFDYSTKSAPFWAPQSGETAAENCYLYANVIDKFVNTERNYDYNADKPANVLYLGLDSSDKIDREMMISCQIHVWDSEKNRAYVGTIDDITPFKYSNEGSKVFIQTIWANPQIVVVYK